MVASVTGDKAYDKTETCDRNGKNYIRYVEGCQWPDDSSGVEFVPWDDGHIPKNLQRSEYAHTRLVRDARYHQPHHHQVQVFDEKLPNKLVDEIYKYTSHQSRPWGTYVTLKEVQSHWTKCKVSTDTACSQGSLYSSNNISCDCDVQSLALKLAAAYFERVLEVQDGDGNVIEDAHGVALWGLGSAVGSEVSYHLDYAEQLRYEYNVIVPPLWAGTLQCSPRGSVEGGSYCVHTGGLDHYQRHGFKASLSQTHSFQDMKAFDNGHDGVGEETTMWTEIPFSYNRMIVQSGHLPHLSTPVTHLAPGVQRVIVGFNVFRHDIGPFVKKAPEHSSAFRRRVTLHGLLECPPADQQSKENKGENQTTRMTADAILSNPLLSKLLVKAKRQKIKDQLRESQRRLDEQIEEELMNSSTSSIQVATFMKCLGGEQWPTPNDVQVHINQRCREGRWRVVDGNARKMNMIHEECFIELNSTCNSDN